MTQKIAIFPGDGIGPEVVGEAVRVLEVLRDAFGLAIELEYGLIGGAALDVHSYPLPDASLVLAKAADAVLLGAVGGPRWDSVDMALRPEKALLDLRSELGLFANLRPALLYAELASASTLRADIVSGLDLMIVRELTGDIYFGQPRGIRTLADGTRQGFNTMVYSEAEIARIAHVAFDIARRRRRQVCSVDKANVLETSRLWREVVTRVAADYPDVSLTHLYVDNAAMQLVKAPKQFDVLVTGNMFGDILSDEAAMLTGSIGMLPSASLDADKKGMYEPIHGSAPDIAGRGVANPLATILSVAMMLRYSLDEPALAARVEGAVSAVLRAGLRTADLGGGRGEAAGTVAMGDAVVAELRKSA